MSLINEIHSQSRTVRTGLWLLSTFIAISFVGFFWFNAAQRDMYLALNRTQEEKDAFAARQDARSPKPLAFIGKGFGSLTAAIGGVFGIDSGAGFDRQPAKDKVYMLPLSR